MEAQRQQDLDEMTAIEAPREASLVPVTEETRTLLTRMFADPHVLEPNERLELVERLRETVQAHPEVAQLRVVYGMALCVNLEVQEAIAELGEGVRLDPESFIAQLKMGELWMRLRVCGKAQEHTHKAALLARNPVQAEMARKQGASIRTMLREGVERGGYKSPFRVFGRLFRRRQTALAVDG
jgi:cytochrome c-type biogenesis protein CcmH/NrfG